MKSRTPPKKSKYLLWDDKNCFYRKSLFKKNDGLNPVACFTLKYNNKKITCGLFNEFVTPSIINDLIEEFTKNESN